MLFRSKLINFGCHLPGGYVRGRNVPSAGLILRQQTSLINYAACICYRPADATKYSFPFSCCNRHAERPCIDVDVNNEGAHFKYNPSTDVTVYRVGCNLGVTRTLREVVFANLRFYGRIAFILEVSGVRHVTLSTTKMILREFTFLCRLLTHRRPISVRYTSICLRNKLLDSCHQPHHNKSSDYLLSVHVIFIFSYFHLSHPLS